MREARRLPLWKSWSNLLLPLDFSAAFWLLEHLLFDVDLCLGFSSLQYMNIGESFSEFPFPESVLAEVG